MYKRVLTIQDISCVGQCSLTVALPILSACGLETAVLPSAVLSTHTSGFSGYTFRDLSEDMPLINSHWNKEGIKFDAVYTGYLGSIKQIEYVKQIMAGTLDGNKLRITDPAMADNGMLYPAFDNRYADAMKSLCDCADIVLPNITEACILTGTPYRETFDKSFIEDVISKLNAKTVILTGVGFTADTTGCAVRQGNSIQYYTHKKIEKGCHGTGDVYASAFVGAYMQGHSAYESSTIAADYVVRCIESTKTDPSHWYGVKFETQLKWLIDKIAG